MNSKQPFSCCLQVLLFFYMLVLFLLFLIQFSIACACLAVKPDQQATLVEEAWQISSPDVQADAQNNFECCGLHTTNSTAMFHPACPKVSRFDYELRP